MSERLERLGFLIASLIQICAIIWWVSALNSTVHRQETLTGKLGDKVEMLTEKSIRVEERLKAFEKDLQKNTDILIKLEEKL